MDRKALAEETVRLLRLQYPEADCTLDFAEPWHLLVAAILAAQCTDERVNRVTPALFARYADPAALAAAPSAQVEELIRSCGLFRNKTKAIQGASSQIVQQHGGQVPSTRQELIALPGIGRKIANLVLGDSFGIPAIVVDTHCARVARMIGLTDSSNPSVIERDLERLLQPQDWITFGHLMVSHGRAICMARRPQCPVCPLNGICRHALDNAERSGR